MRIIEISEKKHDKMKHSLHKMKKYIECLEECLEDSESGNRESDWDDDDDDYDRGRRRGMRRGRRDEGMGGRY